MSRFTEAIAAEPKNNPGGAKCKTGAFHRSLEGEDLHDFEALLDQALQEERTWASVARILGRVDFRVQPKALSSHAKGECRCPKK